MKHKVSELEGALLDAAVAKAQGFAVRQKEGTYWQYEGMPDSWWGCEEVSTEWEYGGPIIQRERICLDAGDEDWVAHAPMHIKLGISSKEGPTPLIAAMRAFVVSRIISDEIDLP